MRIKQFALSATTALLVLGMTGCGSGADEARPVAEGGWEEIVAAADEEGEVSFYSVAPQIQNDRIEAAFKEQYPGITLSITRGATDLPARVSAELNSGSDGADVFLFSDPAWFTEHEEYLLEQPGPAVEGWSDEFWAVDGKSPTAHRGPFSLFVWNTNLFPDGFDQWDDFLDPSVKGKLALREGMTPSLAGYLEFMEDRLGPEYLQALGGQDPKFYPSTVPMAQAVASGEIGVANTNNISNVKELIERGAPVDYTVPSPAFALEFAAGALNTSKRPNAALVFLDFLMSKEGQEALNGDGFGTSGRDLPDDLELDDAVVLDSKKYTPDSLAEWKEKFAEYFGRSAG